MNSEVRLTLDEAVAEVIGHLTGIDLQLDPNQDRYQAITRQINRALRAVALEQEWGYYSSNQMIGLTQEGVRSYHLRQSIRPRVIGDDAVLLVNPNTNAVVYQAFFLPRDAAGKYDQRLGLRVSYTRQQLTFTRAFTAGEAGLEIHVPVMREPRQFKLPVQPLDPNLPPVLVPDEVRNQLVDFDYPDLIIMKAAYFYAQTDPVMQPRLQQLSEDYKTLMYALTERDARNTDAPYQNTWHLGIEGSVNGRSGGTAWGSGIADERGFYGSI